MKKITMIEAGNYTTIEVLKAVLGLPQSRERGISPSDMRTRIKLIDKAEAANDSTKVLLLEDAEYDTMKAIVEHHQFALADRDLLKVLDGILMAETATIAEVKAA